MMYYVTRQVHYLIMSSIILPIEICRVPRDSWAGRMYARRVKLSMLVTANSTSAISWGSSWCQSPRTVKVFTATNEPNTKPNPVHYYRKHPLTGLSEVDTVICLAVVKTEKVAFEHNDDPQRKRSQVHTEHYHVQAVPPVQEVTPEALEPNLLTLIPEKAWPTQHNVNF